MNKIQSSLVFSELDKLDRLVKEVYQKQILISKPELQNEALRGMFSLTGVTTFRYLQEEQSTSAGHGIKFYDLTRFPDHINKDLLVLSFRKDDEEVLYESADSVANWLIDEIDEDEFDEYHTILATYLQSIPLLSQNILLASLCDAEFSTSNEYLIFIASTFLMSDEKNLAQGAAIFLIICCGVKGKEVLQNVLSNEELPHSRLIQGAIKLLS